MKKKIISMICLLCVLTMVGCGSLSKSAIQGDLTGVKSYVAQGEKVNQVDKYGWTPLMWAAYYNYYSIAKYLLENGVDPNIKSTDIQGNIPVGSTALIVAAYYGHKDTVKFLLEHGADKSIKNDAGETARSLAEKYQFTDVVDLLK